MSPDDLDRHLRAHAPLSDCPLLGGNQVDFLPGGAPALEAILQAIDGAREHVHLEYYTLEDVHAGGRSLFTLLADKARAGVEVALTYDAIGSANTCDEAFDGLARAGVRILEYHSLDPLRRAFNSSLNDRDHRKLTVVDGRVGFLGGVNMSRVYDTPESVGRGSSPDQAFWIDNAVRIQGPSVAEIQKLFFHTWRRQDGDPAPMLGGPEHSPPRPDPVGEEVLRIDGSAPRERRPLFSVSIRSAIAQSQRRVALATGYFVPTRGEVRLMAQAARRGVEVDLLLAGYTDVPLAAFAGRRSYDHLLAAGVRIFEVQRGMLHAKIATVDGVWSAVGSSNFDRRSVYLNNEIDAIVFSRRIAAEIEGWLADERARAVRIETRAWRARATSERIKEAATRPIRWLL